MPDTTVLLSRRSFLGSGLAFAALPLAVLGKHATPEDPHIAAVLTLFEPATGPMGRATFHSETLSAAGRRRWPLARFEKEIGEVAALSQGFELVAADRRGTTLWLTMRARRQRVERTLRVRIDRDDPTRIFDVPVSPMPTPYAGPMPQGSIAPADVPTLVAQRIGFAARRDEFSGACRVVSPSGEVVYEAAFGRASHAPDQPNTPATRFNLGSADKSFTALLVARLVGDGRLNFETTLAEVLPDYPDADFARTCTLRHLLSHSAGLGMLFDRPGYDGTQAFSRMADLFPAFAAEPPEFAPGTAAAYSNEGFVVLGAVVEQVTGES
jgi:D-alanyl-D-alanine carboxypeptidase